MSKVYQLDGNAFQDFAGFVSHFSAALLDDHEWNGSLDAIEDILRGGFGTPAEGFTIRFRNTAAARRMLGYPATVAWLQDRSRQCHPANRSDFATRLDRARAGKGPSLFDMVVGIIRDHGTGGSESEDHVVLDLDDDVPDWPFDQAANVAAVSDALVVDDGATRGPLLGRSQLGLFLWPPLLARQWQGHRHEHGPSPRSLARLNR